MEINGKPRIVIWIVSPDQRFIGNAVNILEMQFNGIDIVGVTANVQISATDNHGRALPFIPLKELVGNGRGQYDIILVAGARQVGMSEVTKFARAINLDTDKILGDWIVCIPGFTLQKYRQLQRSRLSIFSMNCFGGIISHTLGLPFLSPFVNLYLKEKDYLRFLSNPHFFINQKLVFERISDDLTEIPNNYPIFSIDNVQLRFQHYTEKKECIQKWKDRKQRINWYNILAVMNTENPDVAEEFDNLPYGKKVCFVPFKSNLDSAFYINPKVIKGNIVIALSNVVPMFYDIFDMLLYGKKTPLIEM